MIYAQNMLGSTVMQNPDEIEIGDVMLRVYPAISMRLPIFFQKRRAELFLSGNFLQVKDIWSNQ